MDTIINTILMLKKEIVQTFLDIKSSGWGEFILLASLLVLAFFLSIVIIKILIKKFKDLDPVKKNLRTLSFYFLFYLFWKQVPGSVSGFLSDVSIFIFMFKLLKVIDYIVVEVFFIRHGRKEVTQIFRDIIKAVIWSFIILMMLKTFFGFSLQDIAVTSAIATAAIGFAFQDTLVNIIAGFSIILEKTYKIGDFIKIKSGELGTVVQMNWRTTQIRNRNNQVIIVPNKEIGGVEIIKYNYYAQFARIFKIGISYKNPPGYVKEQILKFLKNFDEVLKQPAPEIFLKDFKDFYIEYEIRFFLENFETILQVEDKIKTQLWYMFQRQGIEIPFPITNVYVGKPESPVKSDSIVFADAENIEIFLKPDQFIKIIRGKIKLSSTKKNYEISFGGSDGVLDIFYFSNELKSKIKDIFHFTAVKETEIIYLKEEEPFHKEEALKYHQQILEEIKHTLETDSSSNIQKEESFIKHFMNINFKE